MYILELLYKLKDRFSKKPAPKEEEPQEPAECEHIFVPIDSTKEVLACSKCGLLLHTKDIPKKENKGNFFQ